MSYLKIAELTLVDTRELLSGSLKAFNKTYWLYNDKDGSVKYDEKKEAARLLELFPNRFRYLWQGRGEQLALGAKQKQKWGDRNAKSEQASDALGKGAVVSNLAGKSVLEVSQAMYESAKDNPAG
jgi:hypothetical protein